MLAGVISGSPMTLQTSTLLSYCLHPTHSPSTNTILTTSTVDARGGRAVDRVLHLPPPRRPALPWRQRRPQRSHRCLLWRRRILPLQLRPRLPLDPLLPRQSRPRDAWDTMCRAAILPSAARMSVGVGTTNAVSPRHTETMAKEELGRQL